MSNWILPVLMVVVCLTGACKKTPASSPVNDRDTVQFTVSGTTFTWYGDDTPVTSSEGAMSFMESTTPYVPDTTVWSFEFSNDEDLVTLFFLLQVGRPTLDTGTYTVIGHVPNTLPGMADLLGGSLLFVPGTFLGNADWQIGEGDTLTLTIARITDGYAYGTFTAQMGPNVNGAPLGTLTGGLFHHVKIEP